MKLDRRIEQAIDFGAKEIKIRKEVYESLKEETKRLIKLNDIKITFDDNVKEFKSIFQEVQKSEIYKRRSREYAKRTFKKSS